MVRQRLTNPERFSFQKVLSRDLWHLTNRIIRKLLSHSIAVFLNRSLGRDNLHWVNSIKVELRVKLIDLSGLPAF
jgi:hypothetical protein